MNPHQDQDSLYLLLAKFRKQVQKHAQSIKQEKTDSQTVC